MSDIRPDDKFKGYQDKHTLPYKKNDVVVFRKGARLHSMHPRNKGSYLAVRTQEVTINHILSGTTRDVPITNPSVRWAGNGGYWIECDINDIAGLRSAFPDGPKGLKAPKKRK